MTDKIDNNLKYHKPTGDQPESPVTINTHSPPEEPTEAMLASVRDHTPRDIIGLATSPDALFGMAWRRMHAVWAGTVPNDKLKPCPFCGHTEIHSCDY